MTSYRILVTGSRDWTDVELIKKALEKAVVNPEDFRIILVHGGARGADSLAASVARGYGWSIEKHPAKWNEHGPDCPPWHEEESFCAKAGHRRNEYMVSLGADLCVAFIKNHSPGATGAARAAERAGIPVIRFEEKT